MIQKSPCQNDETDFLFIFVKLLCYFALLNKRFSLAYLSLSALSWSLFIFFVANG